MASGGGVDTRRIGARRQRMTEADTRRTALHTAVAAIEAGGLTVSLEHISMEDVIRESGVSRTTFYRLWPQKEQFIGDLLVELARDAIPTRNTRGAQATTEVKEFLLPRLDDLRDEASRRRLAIDLILYTAAPDFAHTVSLSAQWRTYFGLIASVMNLPDGETRDAAREAIRICEQRYRERLTGNYRRIMSLLGLRIREDAGATLDDVAAMLIALIRGLVLAGQAADSAQNPTPLGVGLTAILDHCLEPDPMATWDQDRIDALRASLTGTDDLFASER